MRSRHLFKLIGYNFSTALASPVQGLPDVLEQAMRVYAILGALLIVLIELELERLLWLFRFAEYWIGRAQVQVLHRTAQLGCIQPSVGSCTS